MNIIEQKDPDTLNIKNLSKFQKKQIIKLVEKFIKEASSLKEYSLEVSNMDYDDYIANLADNL